MYIHIRMYVPEPTSECVCVCVCLCVCVCGCVCVCACAFVSALLRCPESLESRVIFAGFTGHLFV